MWSIWDKQSDINGCSAESVLESFKHLANEEVIYIKTINGRVTQIEGKNILADHYGIDPTFPDDEFIAEYEEIMGVPDEPTEPEGDESATYDELMHVYEGGVNSLDE